VVVDGRVHVVEGDVDKIAGDDVKVGHCLRQEGLHPLKGAVNISDVNDSHSVMPPDEINPDNLINALGYGFMTKKSQASIQAQLST
jgi:hypothetical protein